MAVTEAQLADAVRDFHGARRPFEVEGGGRLLADLPAPPACERLCLGEFRGVVAHDRDDLTVTARAGTPVVELEAVLEASGQECPIAGPGSTIGGRIASGLTGPYRLGTGHIREWLLGGRLITADGVAMRFGARTVKNVTGYDLPRLLCGSWGTLAVLTELTLRVRPVPAFRAWYTADVAADIAPILRCAAAVIRTRDGTHVFLEGRSADCAVEVGRHGLRECGPPALPRTARLSVPPAQIDDVLAEIDGPFAAELGVGVVHTDPARESLPRLRRLCESLGGRLLAPSREAGIPVFADGDADGPLDRRVKHALDPAGLLAPWRFSS